MLACKLYGFTGDSDNIAKKHYIFVIFEGGGGPDLLSPALDLHMVMTTVKHGLGGQSVS